MIAVHENMTEDRFEEITKGIKLTEVEREALRRRCRLPCNEKVLSYYTRWENYAVAAWQKVQGK